MGAQSSKTSDVVTSDERARLGSPLDDDASLERRSVLEVARESVGPGAVSFRSELHDELRLADEITELDSVRISGRADDSWLLEELAVEGGIGLSAAHLVGQSVLRGFRRQLDPLKEGTPNEQAMRRMMWDFPLALMINGQTSSLDHPALKAPQPMGELPGVNQCSGWRAGGDMLTSIERAGGMLRMKLSDELVGDEHLGDTDPPPLAPLASRRRRQLTVRLEGDELKIRDRFRDSYSDPDGIERALHHWIVDVRAGVLDHVITQVEVTSMALPWLECPSAGGSGVRLVGRTLEDAEVLVGTEFKGITTCTHLNDTLVMLSGVPEMLGRLLS